MNRRFLSATLSIILLSFSALQAQDSNEELAAKAANPLANLISLPFQNNTNFGLGPYDRTNNVLNIQPVVPLSGGKVITRTIFPIVWVPDFSSAEGMASTGLGDILFSGWYAVSKGKSTYGIGPAISFPSGGEIRGSQKWSVGPSVVVLTAPAPWTLGLLVNNIWSVAGDADAGVVNQGVFQYFIVRTFPGGWYVNSAPILIVNWEAESGQQWVVPFGAGVGKIVRLGKLPINTQVGAYYNVVKPDFGPSWQFRVQTQLLLPTSIFGG